MASTLGLFNNQPVDLFVANIAENASMRNLRVLFSQYGEVTGVRKGKTGRFAFVVSNMKALKCTEQDTQYFLDTKKSVSWSSL